MSVQLRQLESHAEAMVTVRAKKTKSNSLIILIIFTKILSGIKQITCKCKSLRKSLTHHMFELLTFVEAEKKQ